MQLQEKIERKKQSEQYKSVMKFYNWCDKNEEDKDHENFARWDEHENGKKCLNWDKDYRLRHSILVQASGYLWAAGVMPTASGIPVPTILSTDGERLPIDEMELPNIEKILSSFQAAVTTKAFRARWLGAKSQQIKKALKQAGIDADQKMRQKEN